MVLGLGCALQALFGSCAPHDLVPLAEADPRALRPMLVPELLQALVDLLDLVSHGLASPPGEQIPQLGALLAQGRDLGVNVGNRSHARQNARPRVGIPLLVASEQNRNNRGCADDTGGDRERVEDGHHEESFLLVAELCDPVLVEPEVVSQLVQDRDPDLLLELPWVAERLGER